MRRAADRNALGSKGFNATQIAQAYFESNHLSNRFEREVWQSYGDTAEIVYKHLPIMGRDVAVLSVDLKTGECQMSTEASVFPPCATAAAFQEPVRGQTHASVRNTADSNLAFQRKSSFSPEPTLSPPSQPTVRRALIPLLSLLVAPALWLLALSFKPPSEIVVGLTVIAVVCIFYAHYQAYDSGDGSFSLYSFVPLAILASMFLIRLEPVPDAVFWLAAILTGHIAVRRIKNGTDLQKEDNAFN